jgi:hypothetical protein
MLIFQAVGQTLRQHVAKKQLSPLVYQEAVKRPIDFCAPQCHLLQCGKVIP